MKLHLVNDEKIINRTIDMFEEAFPGENVFVVVNRSTDFQIVRQRERVLSRTAFRQHQNEFCFSEIYIHWLDLPKIKFIKQLYLKDVSIYWIIWGLDLYNQLLAPKGFSMIDKKTSSYYRQKHSGLKIMELPFRKCRQQYVVRKVARFVREKVDYIVTDTTENDYDYLMRYYPELKGKPWKDFFYYPLDIVLGNELMQAQTTGNDIAIGHSASVTNNHEYVFQLLSKLNIGNRRVVVPLSYGVKKKYVEAVITAGRRLLGKNFMPLREFMPLDEYNRLQTSINVALFANLRQEAIGNIIVYLYLGAKVFLPAGSPVYEWAQGHGLTVFDLTRMTQQDIDTPLDAACHQRNREILSALYHKDRMMKLIKALPERHATTSASYTQPTPVDTTDA